MSQALSIRIAEPADIPALREVMELAIEHLQRGFLTPEQIIASRAVMGMDSQLIEDRTYLVVKDGDTIVGCGGWSRRATLYGGDHSTALRNARLLDPACEAARIRAMYTHPDHARRGIGRLIITACEDYARAEGFGAMEMMSTMSGQPLYEACGYQPVRPEIAVSQGVEVPLMLMRKALA
jgi:GNAT superfamily N-acetyltransferase